MSKSISGPISRRSFLAAAGAGALAASVTGAGAQASSFARITVDVSELQRLGLGPYAEFVRSTLGRALQQSFAGRLGGAGPGMIVRITAVTLSGFAGSAVPDGGGFRDGGGSGGGGSDYMDGEAVIVNGRSVVRRFPQLVSLPSSSGGAWYLEDFNQRRTAALCDSYAYWLARYL